MRVFHIITLLVVCASLGFAAPAQVEAEAVKTAVYFDVNTTSDNGEQTPGNCICETIGATSFCSLRAAIEESNACIGDNEIRLNNGVTYTIATPLEVNVNSDISTETITLRTDEILDSSPKAVIQGTGAKDYSAFEVALGTLTINNITISNSEGIYVARSLGGETVLDGRLNLSNVLMIDNWEASTTQTDSRYGGGAIQNSLGTVTISNSVFNNNRSINNCGGAINNSGHLVIHNSSFIGNIAPLGGAICHTGLTLTTPVADTWNMEIYDSEFSGNTATYHGGAIYLSGPSFYGEYNLIRDSYFHGNIANSGAGGAIFAGQTEINPYGGGFVLQRSTISENTATYGAGLGLANPGNFQSHYVVYLENSTISGNLAGKHGGGIYMGNVILQVNPGNPTVYVHNTTITNNTADSSGTEAGNGGGIYNSATDQLLLLKNSILAENLDASTGISIKVPDCWGGINLEGYNIIGRSGGCDLDTDGSSLIGNSSSPIDPLLKPLDQDGYLIPTHGLLTGSPAINGGNPAGCKDILDLVISLDQRGEPRPFDSICDIGSVEAQFFVRKVFLPTVLR